MAKHGATYQQLIDYAAGDLSGPVAAIVEAAVSTDAAAARTVAFHRLAMMLLRTDDSFEPPAEILQSVCSILRPAAVHRTLIDRATAAIDAIVGRLVFDSRAQPALAGAGLRGEMTGFQLTWELEDADLDLQVEPVDGGDTERWRVMGQLSTSQAGPAVSRVELCLPGTSEAAHTSETDDRGVFTLEVDPGTYDLRLHRPGSVAVFPDLHVP